MFCSQTSLYRIGLVGLPFFKCDEMRLRSVFTVQTAVFLLKIPLNSCLMGLDQIYTGRAGGNTRGKGFNNIISTVSTVFPEWPLMVINDVAGVSKVPSSILNLFLFASLLFFFSFSFR